MWIFFFKLFFFSFQSFPDVDGPYPRMTGDDPWLQNASNPYHEEVQFPPQQNFQVLTIFEILGWVLARLG